MVEKCYDFFGCRRIQCPMFNEDETRECWEVDGTLNNCVDGKQLVGDYIEDKITFCRHCLYYKYRMDLN